MSIRFSKLVLVLLLVGLVFLCAAAVFLWRGWQAYHAITVELENQHAQLVRLQARSPYPSEANVRTVAGNFARIERFLSQVISSLRTNQVQPIRIEPADFPAVLEKEIRYLSREAAEAQVILPEDFTFGFEQYVRGKIPLASDVERLTVQLQQVRRICSLLFSAGISELDDLRRQEFDLEREAEVPERARRRRRRVPPAEVSGELRRLPRAPDKIADLVDLESYRFTVSCSEPAFWKLLLGLANAPFCAVVTSIEVENQKFGTLTQTGRGEGVADALRQIFSLPASMRSETGTERPLTREERVVAGREEIRVTIQLNVYRFREEEETRP
ncbi:MAG TPA: hypothetical protein EYP62_09295 [Kiritimatiellae bacterium]|nr:hypothetical protein [Kiritimatiellia bacterium]